MDPGDKRFWSNYQPRTKVMLNIGENEASLLTEENYCD